MTGSEHANNKLIVIQGATASGKTGISVALAKELSTVIISADSRQFYKQMSIGTAKPTLHEQGGIEHFFIDSHDITDELTAARFAREAEKKLGELFLKKDTIILTGGSGMYVDALCRGLDEIPTDPVVKAALTELWKKKGLEPLLIELEKYDPEMYRIIDKKNPSRLIRALEVNRIMGKPFSELRTGSKKERPFSVIRFIIEHPREKLYNRIEDRVDMMIELGLISEVRSLLNYRDLGIMKTVGYSEVFQYLDKQISFETTVSLIKQHTRNYAKRQLTWLRRYDDAIIIPYSNQDDMLADIIAKIYKTQI